MTPHEPETLALERHFTIHELGELWNLAPNTVRKLFEDEPGVLKFSQPRLLTRKQKPHVTLRIPATVVARLHEKRSAAADPLEVKRRRRGIE